MTRLRLIIFGAVLSLSLSADVGSAAVTIPEASRSVASLLAPAHGEAFAFGRPGHLLTTAAAVGTSRSVTLVVPGGQSETATVIPTSDTRLVQLRGRLKLAPLRGEQHRTAGSSLTLVTGPLDGSRTIAGELRSAAGETTLGASPSYEGAPLLSDRGFVEGVATERGAQVWLLGVRRLRVLPTATTEETSAQGRPLVAVIAIVLAVWVGVAAARIAIRWRMFEALAERSERRARPRGATPRQRGGPRVPARGRDAARATRDARLRQEADQLAAPMGRGNAYSDEFDSGADVVLRRREQYEPAPEVRLLGPRSAEIEGEEGGPCADD